MGSVIFTKGVQLNNPNTASLYGYSESGGSSSILAGSFGVSNYTIKIQPNTNFAYSFISRNVLYIKFYGTMKFKIINFDYINKELKSSPTIGSASVCTARFVKTGDNVPCLNPLVHYINPLTNYDFAYAYQICSTSKGYKFWREGS